MFHISYKCYKTQCLWNQTKVFWKIYFSLRLFATSYLVRNSNSLLILSLVIYKLSSKKGILKLETLTAVIKVKEIEKNIFASTKKIDITESGANKNKTYCMKNLWWCITRKLLYSLKRVLTYHRGLGERWQTFLIGELFGCINYHQLLMHI